jgi:hypothetical protein
LAFLYKYPTNIQPGNKPQTPFKANDKETNYEKTFAVSCILRECRKKIVKEDGLRSMPSLYAQKNLITDRYVTVTPAAKARFASELDFKK